MLKNVVTLGVTIALMVFMAATVATAQSDKTKAYGLNKEPICHNGHTLYLPDPAIDAHMGHGDNSGACGEVVEPPPACEGDPVEGAAIEADEALGTTLDVVDAGDVLLIAGNFELAASGTVSVTLEDEDGTQGTFEDGVNAEITQQEDGSLLITVTGDPIGVAGGDSVLNTTGLTGVSSEGIACADEVIPPTECENPVEGATIEADEALGTTLDVVDAGDVLLIAGNFELAASGTVSVTVEDEDGTQGTFEDGANAEITQQEDGSLLITVTGDPIPVDGAGGEDDVLDTAGLTGVSSEGISCADEVVDAPGTTDAVYDAVLQPTLGASALVAEQVTDHQGPPEPFAHPFCDSGWEYAQEHITEMAQNETPGLTGPPTARPPVPGTEHAPGAHQGFAVCDPSAN